MANFPREPSNRERHTEDGVTYQYFGDRNGWEVIHVEIEDTGRNFSSCIERKRKRMERRRRRG